MIIRLKQCSKKEIHVANPFLSARNMSEAEVECQHLEVYGEDTRVDKSTARQKSQYGGL